MIAAGAFWFIPATGIGTYWAFLTGLFILAAGMACLETIANPYTTLLGAAEHGATRINIAQSFNGIGWILGPIVGGHLVFVGGTNAEANARLYLPYVGVGIGVAVLFVVFALAYVPDLQAVREMHAEAESTGKKPLWRRPRFSIGVAAQLLYVAAQTGIFSFFINYVIEYDNTVSEKQASHWLGGIGFVLFLTGRLCGSFVISQFKPQRVMATYATRCVILTALVISGGKLGLYGLFGTLFFMSIMFPTIFALSICGLGDQTKFASSLVQIRSSPTHVIQLRPVSPSSAGVGMAAVVGRTLATLAKSTLVGLTFEYV